MERITELRLIRLFVGLEESRFRLTGFDDRTQSGCWIYTVEPDERPRLCSRCGHEAEKHKDQWIWLKDLPIGLQAKEVWLKIRRYQVWCQGCHGYFREKMPFRGEAGRISRRLELYIEELVSTKMISVKDLSRMFGLDWDTVYRIDMNLLQRRYAEMEKPNPRHIAVDEKSFKKGHKYVTIITDVEKAQVIYVSIGRTKAALDEFFKWIGQDRCKAIETIAMDLHPDYHASARQYIPKALHVPDKFHIVQKLNETIAHVFKELSFKETGVLRQGALPRDIRWLIKRKIKNQSPRQMEDLKRLKERNEPLFEAYLLKDSFHHFFDFLPQQIEEARKFLIEWVVEAMRTKIKSLEEFAHYIKRNIELLLNVIRTGRTSSISEGINNKISVIKRIAYGYRNIHYFMLKILQRCGILGLPQTHPKSS